MLQNLDRYGTKLDGVPATKHDRHPAATDLFPNLVTRKDRALQILMQLAGIVGDLPDAAVRSA